MIFDEQVEQLIEAARRGRPDEIRHWLKVLVPEYDPAPVEGGVAGVEIKTPAAAMPGTQSIRVASQVTPAGTREPQPVVAMKSASSQ